ncbi:GNAT family N-acetyltransferase [Streptomyces sp. NPDC051561]|uniref:GNAT family N-acetyltransferase n=1 Tax=Streptomyces sp. NPDC051561 TaxID=3365658 RepID=UPI0037B6F801
MNHRTVRRATADDAAELLRLRQIMIESMRHEPAPTDWQDASLPRLRKELADQDGNFAVFVGEHPDGGGKLGTMVAGTIDYRIGGPPAPLGDRGHIFGVVTEPDARRLGAARACTVALLDWFRERGVAQVDLSASADAEPLYASLGFVCRDEPAMRLNLT